MKNIFFFLLLLSTAFIACEKEDDHDDDATDYHAHILSPDASNKKVGDEIAIHVQFEDHNGGTVHHINVKIYNKANPSQVIYNKPDEAHVHETSGEYDFTDTFKLDVDPHTDWVLEAKVWGHEDGVGEVSETVEFHVHPH
ncbi:MAG TPA: hypothetical protein PKC40_00695 [Saprospiraceae bacterium]|nr:hypothetical protein [Saprospiraceae bacterium]